MAPTGYVWGAVNRGLTASTIAFVTVPTAGAA